MYYFCVEDEQLVSVLNYEPNVPSTVKVIAVTEEKKLLMDRKTHYFDGKTLKIKPYPKQSATD